jgi:hypothetical protein
VRAARTHLVGAVALIALLATGSAPRAADDAPVATPERPWAANVPQARQDDALLIYEEANKLFEDSQHAAALAKYREALKVWDHPAIHYNAAVALIYLDQPLAAYENLEAALKYGSAPFNGDTYQQALTYRKLLRGQLAELEVTCGEPGAEVTLDGRPLFVGPGAATRTLLPGPHQLVARKPVFLTETRSLTLLPGKPAVETLRLQDLRTLPTKTVRRWPVWKPLAVLGAGALVAAIGVPFYLDAKSNVRTYDAEVKRLCSGPSGCAADDLNTTSPWALDSLHRGRVENVIAVSLFSVGAAVAASGVALAIMNQPRVVPADEATRAQLSPLLGPGLVGVSVAFSR